MKRSEVPGWLIMVVASFFPLAGATAGAAAPRFDVPAVDIAFESAAPYYQPQVAIVSAGAPIRWSNATASPHSIRHDGCLTGDVCAFRSIAVYPDENFMIAPLPPGQYPYHCELHPIMRGTLVVVDAGSMAEEEVALAESRK